METTMAKMPKAAKSSTFYRDMFRLALPIVFQNLITTAVGSADVIMLGWVSQTALSAGSLARHSFPTRRSSDLVLGKEGYPDH